MTKQLFLFLITATVSQTILSQNCQNLFISEYVEGWSNNKAVEIYNPTNSPINLSTYKIARYPDGSVSAVTVQLNGIIQPHDVHVAVLDKRDPNGTGSNAPVWDSLQALADEFYCPSFSSNSTFYFSGNDAIALLQGNTIIDLIGKIGENPADEFGNTQGNNGGWSTIFPYSTGQGIIVTRDHSLIRKDLILNGNPINPLNFNSLLEWDSIPPVKVRLDINGDTVFNVVGDPILDGNWNSLGYHNCYCDPCYNISTSPTISSIVSCGSYISSNGEIISTSSLITDTLQNFYGCDSIVNVNFTYSPVVINLIITHCGLQYISPSGNLFNNSSLIYDTLFNTGGCDTVYIIDLIINQPVNFSIFDTICGGPYYWNNQSYSTSGTYFQTFQAANGCDSTVTLYLTIYPTNFNQTFTSSQQLFTAPPFAVQFTNTTPNASNYSFTWFWGDGTSTTSNNPTVFHEYLTNGLYSVTLQATNNQTGCTDDTTYVDYIFTTGGASCTHSAALVQSGPINACSGQNVVLSCNSSPTFSYQWRKNGVYIQGNNNDTLVVTQSGIYSVIISENGCPVSSNAITVNFAVIQTPVISSTGAIQPCVGGSVTLNTTPGFNSYLWSNGATTPSTTVTSSGNYTVQVTNANGCTATSAPYTVNASILPTQNICVVGVDSATTNLRVVWEKPITTAIDSFYIYKESAVANVYTQVGARHYDSLSVWIDPVSNPSVQAYRYKITALDTCGSETPLSDFHKSIHLTINQGVGGAWNLIWSPYEGIAFGSYNIYRGTSPSNLSLLTTIQSNLFSYTDLTPPSGNIYYQIEIVNPSNCNPTKLINYGSARSNIASNSTGGLGEESQMIALYPNPASDKITLKSYQTLEGDFEILDPLGKLVQTEKCNGKEVEIDLNQLAAGNYILRLPTMNWVSRIVKN